MKLSNWDFEIALVAWLASGVTALFFQPATVLVIGTTFNLWHQRNVLYKAGEEFERRVRSLIAPDLLRLVDVEKKAQTLADEQTSIKVNLGGAGPAQRRFG